MGRTLQPGEVAMWLACVGSCGVGLPLGGLGAMSAGEEGALGVWGLRR